MRIHPNSRTPAAAILFALVLPALSVGCRSTAAAADDPEAKPPVTADDIRIVQRAHEILDTEAKWNRADNRKCPKDATTWSLYCALERATDEVSHDFKHRGAAMQESRFVIDEIAPHHKQYDHRLMDYNNDPTTTFADLQEFFRRLEDRVARRLQTESGGHQP